MSKDQRPLSVDEQMQKEFNEWAAAGRGEEMERHHASIVEQTLRQMDLRPGERVLDLGCGAGWATRILARFVSDGPQGHGQVVGVDISDEMIRRARAGSKDFDNIMFVWGSAHQIPWEENYFDKVLSVESFYYYGDQDRAMHELFRVMAPHGKLYILINLYQENPYSLRWVEELNVPVHARSENEYVQMLKEHGFEQVEARRIPDLSPTPEEYSGKWFKDAEELRDFKRIGALLLVAEKPNVRSPAPPYQIY
jgi:ubiquinone/menaquinone biosynthesis C-methylase UbiE